MRVNLCKPLYVGLLWVGVLAVARVAIGLEDPFEVTWDRSLRQVAPGETMTVEVMISIPPGHYLYRDKTNLRVEEGNGLERVRIELPPPVVRHDRFFKKDLEIYEAPVLITAELRVSDTVSAGRYQARLAVSYQGCSSKLCFRQQTRDFSLPFEVQPVASEGISLAVWLQRSLAAHGPLAYLIAFAGGVLTDFTPCVIPLIPLTLAVIGIRREKGTGRNFLLSTTLAIAMSVAYACLGVVAALAGLQLGFLFQSPLFLLIGAVLFLLFALAMFGVVELQVPLPIRNRLAKVGGRGYLGAVLSGVTLGVLAAPCVGPIIGALLIWVAQTRDASHGFGLLFAYGLGMGSLMIVVGTFYGTLAGKVHGGVASLWLQRVLGVLLLIPAVYYGYIATAGLRISEKRGDLVSAEGQWHHDYQDALTIANREGKLLLVDFYAEWCLPCLEWEQKTFSDRSVQALLRERFVTLRVDCTQNTSLCDEMVKRFDVIGWPTILLTDAHGTEVSRGRIVGEVYPPGRFLPFLQQAVDRARKIE